MTYEQENDKLGSTALKIAQDPKTSSEELVELVVRGGADCLLSVAEELVIHPNATPELYELLSDNEWRFVRLVVGGCPLTPQQTLTTLASDMNPSVRGVVEQNPNTPPLVRMWLTSDYHKSISLEEFLLQTQGATNGL